MLEGAGDITALIRVFEREEMAELAGAVAQPTVEDDAAAKTPAAAPAAAAAGATAAAGAPAKASELKSKQRKKKQTGDDDGSAPNDADDTSNDSTIAAALDPTQPWVGPSAGGGSESGAARSGAGAKKSKKPKKPQGDAPAEPSRVSGRNQGVAAQEDEDLDALAKRSRDENKKKAKKASGAGSASDGPAGAALGAGGQPVKDDPPWTSKVNLGAKLREKTDHKNRANQKHASEVWDRFSPTGIELGEDFCKKTFGHSDGKAWAVGVYNPILHAAPKKPLDGDYFPSTRDRLRFYEKQKRSLCFVPRIAPARINVDNINPNQRQLPTDHKFDPARFHGVLLSALDLVWFTEKDNASKSSYADWAGSIKKLEEPTRGVHKYFSDIVPGYYVKLDSSETKKYAVLYAFRPFKSADGEPEIM